MGVLSKIGLAVPVTIGNLITKGLSKVTGKEYGHTTIQEASETKFGKVLGTAITATAVALVPAVAGKTATIAASKTAAKAIAPKTATGALKATAATLVAAPILIESKKARQAVASTPQALIKAGSEIGKVIEGEKSITDISTKDLAKAGAVVGAGALLSLGTAAIVKEVAERKEEKIIQPAEQITTPEPMIIKQAEIKTSGDKAITPETQVITATSGTASKKRKKTRSKPLPQQIKQSVGISIINNNSNRQSKRYLNTIALRN